MNAEALYGIGEPCCFMEDVVMNTLDARRHAARQLLPGLVLLSLLSGATHALGGQRPEVGRADARQESHLRSRPIGTVTDFRADKIVPDICKGCST